MRSIAKPREAGIGAELSGMSQVQKGQPWPSKKSSVNKLNAEAMGLLKNNH